MNINSLIRANIKKLKPYASARNEFKDLDKNKTFLDANENPFKNGLNRYPDPQQVELKQRLSEVKGCNVNQLLIGNGSDEVLDLIFRAFCEPQKDSVILLPPTYGMYEVLANLNAIETIKVPLTSDFQLQVSAVLEAATATTKLLFLCAPNNPTANSFDANAMQTLLQNFKGIVVLDEAYIDFSDGESWVRRIDEFPNLIIVQTLSKAYGLAGIRLGIGMASPKILRVLNSINPPYNINQLSQEVALIRLDNLEFVKHEINQIKEQRSRVISSLKSLKIVQKIHPSDANFILVQMDDADKRYKQLIENSIVVRNRSQEPLCGNCLRFTIGTPEENTKLLNVLNRLL